MKYVKIIIAVVGIGIVLAGIFWFSSQTQNVDKPQTIQKEAADDSHSFLCAWKTADSKKHTFEVAIVDVAGNVIRKENIATDASSPDDVSEHTFTNVPEDQLIGARCQVKIIDLPCDVSFTGAVKPFCPKISDTGTPPVTTTTMTPTATPESTSLNGSITMTPTATPGDTSIKGGTGTPTATATPGDTSTRGGAATPGAATATLPAATATAAAKATATGVAATATSGAAATATRAASSSSSSSSTATVTGATATGTTTSLPASGTVHPAIILGILSLFVIALGLVL